MTLTRKKLSACLQADLTPENLVLIRQQLENASSSFTQHHVEIIVHKLQENVAETYIDTLERLVEVNSALVIPTDGVDPAQCFDDGLRYRLLVLILKTNDVELPVELQKKLRPEHAALLQDIDPVVLQSQPLFVQLRFLQKVEQQDAFLEQAINQLIANKDSAALKALVDLHDQVQYAKFIGFDQLLEIVTKFEPEPALGLASNYSLQNPLSPEQQVKLCQLASTLFGDDVTANASANLMCALQQTEQIIGAFQQIYLQNGFPTAVQTIADYFRLYLAEAAQQLDAGGEADMKCVETIADLLADFALQKVRTAPATTVSTVTYALMEGLSSQKTAVLLRKYAPVIEELATYMEGLEREDWAEDWEGWLEAVRSMLE